MSGPDGAGLDVRGGPGGTAASFDALDLAAGRLLGTGRALAELGLDLAAAALRVGLGGSAVVGPGGFAAAQAHSLVATGGPHGVAAAAERVGWLGTRLRLAVLGYRGADAAVQAWLRGLPVDLLLPGARGLLLPDRSLAGVALLAGTLPGLHEPTGLRVAVTSPPRPVRAPSGLAGLVDRVGGVSPGAGRDPAQTGSPPGTVRVERVTGADGRRAWVVEIPGTQVWAPGAGPDPLDAAGAVGSLAGGLTSAARLVLRAMELAGVRPGEPVLLAGHSQGGMVAANLAAAPQVRRRYMVTHVLTLGSPVALARVPRSVQVLSLEHTGDVVPRLDGTPNPRSAAWTTVRAPTPGTAAGAGAAWAHSTRAYALTAAQVDGSTDPALQAVRAGLARFLDGPGVTCVGIEVTGRRVSASG